MERIIRGPEWDSDYGTAEQCAKYVGMEISHWLELDRADLILPPAARRSREVARWHWHSAVMVSLSLVQLTGRLRAWLQEQKKNPKKLRRTRGERPESDAR